MNDWNPFVRRDSDILLQVSLVSICAAAGLRVIRLGLKGLADVLAGPTVQAFLQTHLFQSGLVLLALGIAASVAWLRRQITSLAGGFGVANDCFVYGE